MVVAKLRPVDVVPVEVGGESLIAFRDPLGISRKLVALPAELFFIATLLDGRNSLEDIQAAYVKRFGTPLYTGQIQHLIEQLDENLLLDNIRFREHFLSAKEDFAKLSIRPATCTPSAYSADPDECAERFEGFLEPARRDMTAPTDALVGIVTPHVDIDRGAAVYGPGYALIERLSDVQLFVVFGTCHGSMERLFALTAKDWVSPFGKVAAARDIVRQIAERTQGDFFHDEFAHRAEHSIEIQVAVLSYLLRERKDFQIVPILCGNFDRFVGDGRTPSASDEFQDFMGALSETLGNDERKCLFLAAADLAHVGPKFGDSERLTQERLLQVQRADKESIAYMTYGDADGFFRSVSAEQRVCGLAPIYATLYAAGSRSGRILGYEQWVEQTLESSVSFTSVALYK